MIIKYCDFCKQNIEVKNYQSFGGHRANCSFNPNNPNKIKKCKSTKSLCKQYYNIYCNKCNKLYTLLLTKECYDKENYRKHCSRKCANSKPHTEESKNKISFTNSGGHPRFSMIICKNCKKEKKVIYRKRNQIFCSNICSIRYRNSDPHYLKKLSKIMKGKTGGFREFNGKKSGHYRGILFQSPWELSYIVYHLEHNISFERNHKYFLYTFENGIHKYYPDFIKLGKYIEIKGWFSKRFKAKVKYFPKTEQLEILNNKDILPYLNYCINKYGKDFLNILKDKPVA